MLANENPAMKYANQTASKFYTSKEERRLYEAAERYSHDRASLLDDGYQEGHADGLSMGKAEGISETKISIASEMLKNGFELEVIMRLTKLSKEEILNL